MQGVATAMFFSVRPFDLQNRSPSAFQSISLLQIIAPPLSSVMHIGGGGGGGGGAPGQHSYFIMLKPIEPSAARQLPPTPKVLSDIIREAQVRSASIFHVASLLQAIGSPAWPLKHIGGGGGGGGPPGQHSTFASV